MSEPRDDSRATERPPRSFDPADKTQPAEGGRDEAEDDGQPASEEGSTESTPAAGAG